MSMHRILFQLSPERAHRVAMSSLEVALGTPGVGGAIRRRARPGASLERSLFGKTFAHPVGLAAGFDKNARHVLALEALGFGFVEIGSVTAQPWAGNPSPRLFRLPADRALINRMGLNNEGAEAIARRLESVRDRVSIPVLVNVAKTPDPSLEGDAAITDYVSSVRRMRGLADAIVLNVSCPNSGDGRTFEDAELLSRLLQAVRPLLDSPRVPLLAKISADLSDEGIADVVRVGMEAEVDGFVMSNPTIHRDALVHTSAERVDAIGAGGMSGAPLHARAVDGVRRLSAEVQGRVPIIGVGGVEDAASASDMLAAGASLVELYTGFVYGGPFVVRSIVEGLAEVQ